MPVYLLFAVEINGTENVEIERKGENEKTIRVHRMDSRMALLSHIFTFTVCVNMI